MAESRAFRAEKDAAIERIIQSFHGEDLKADLTQGTPGHEAYREWLKERAPVRNWDQEASTDLDRYIDARTPAAPSGQARLPQTDAILRLDVDRRLVVREGDARRDHWALYRQARLTVRARVVTAIDKEVRYATNMMMKYQSDTETTEDVLKRLEEGGDAQGKAA